MSKEITRREFVKRGSLGLAAGTVILSTSAKSYSRIIGSNNAIVAAAIGIRSRGGGIAREFAESKNVRLKYIVDIDENLYEETLSEIEKIAGYKPQTEWDMRNVFDDKEVDVVSAGLPNHWHALATVWACQAGKHVYVEKPSSHNVWEGRKMVEASRKYNTLVQVGFQNRSNLNANRAMKYLHDGNLGDIYMARGLCFKPRGDIGSFPDGPENEGGKYTEKYLSKVHYDMWLGPAPKRPFNVNRFHYNWHWHWDYGNGDTGNQGPHQFDIARWGLNKDEYPVKVRSHGGYYKYKSSQETPNTQTSLFEYADGKLLEFGTRGLFTNPEGILLPDFNISSNGEISAKTKAKPITIGNIFLGTEGWMQIDAGGNWQTFFGRKNDPGPTSGDKDDSNDPLNLAGSGGGGHLNNLLTAIRSGKREDLTCDIEKGHLSSALPLIANISYRLGRELTLDGNNERFIEDKEADKMLSRDYRKEFEIPKEV